MSKKLFDNKKTVHRALRISLKELLSVGEDQVFQLHTNNPNFYRVHLNELQCYYKKLWVTASLSINDIVAEGIDIVVMTQLTLQEYHILKGLDVECDMIGRSCDGHLFVTTEFGQNNKFIPFNSCFQFITSGELCSIMSLMGEFEFWLKQTNSKEDIDE